MIITHVSHISKIFFKVMQLRHTSGTQFNANKTYKTSFFGLSSPGKVPFHIELFIISLSTGKYVSTESIRTFTGIQELAVDFFLFKDFMTFFTSLDDTSFK